MTIIICKSLTMRQDPETKTILHYGTPPSIESIRSTIRTVNYNGYYHALPSKKIIDTALEYSASLPVLADAFYRRLEYDGHVPTLETYIDAYYLINHIFYPFPHDGKVVIPSISRTLTFSDTALKARLCRAYPSFCREIDLLAQLWGALPQGFDAQYNSHLDRQNIDILVRNGHTTVGISSFLNSSRSNSFRQTKVNDRHRDDPFKPTLSLSIRCNMTDKANCELVGDIYLHTHSAVKQLVAAIVTKCQEARQHP